EYEALAAESDYAESMVEAEDVAQVAASEIGWTELRREIMRRGGIASGPYTRHWLPGQVYRVKGAAPDVLAADMADEGWGTWEDAEDFLAHLWKLFEAYKAEQAARIRRSPKVVEIVEADAATEEIENDGADDAGMPALRIVAAAPA